MSKRLERLTEYNVLEGLLRDISFLISSQGKTVLAKEDPVTPVEVLHNNLRNNLRNKEADVERCVSAAVKVKKKVSEK